MTEEEFEDSEAKEWAENFAYKMRGDKSPQEFILSQKADMQRVLAEKGEEVEVGMGDVIATLLQYQGAGIISENDVQQVLGPLGQQFGIENLTPDQYFGEFVPEVKEQLAAQAAQERQEAEQRAREEAADYAQHWGIQRLDGIAQYYEDHSAALEGVEHANWEGRLERYKREREELAQNLPELEDPFARRDALARAIFFLTGLHPSESPKIHNTESALGSFVYLDSLFDLSRRALYTTAFGKSPEESDASYSFGGIGVSIKVYTIDNPASMTAAKREGAFSSLAFGAASPAERYTLGKPIILPYQSYTMRRL